MLASVLAAEVLKEVVPRPALVSGPGWLLRNSFPSGTVAAATAIAVGALLVAPERLRWAVLPVGAGYAALIAHAVQATGWHRLSDTIGSVLLVVGVSCLGLLVLAAAGLAQPSSVGRIHSRILGATVVGATVALMLGTVLIALAAAFPLLTAPEGGRRVFLQTAFPLLGAGITGLVLVLFARAIAPFSFGARGPDERTAPDATPPGTASGAGPTAADSPNEDAASRRRRRSPRSA